eukprot:1161446-Pelagomonas_calceolata.AAC.18
MEGLHNCTCPGRQLRRQVKHFSPSLSRGPQRKCSICGIRRWSWLTLPRCSQGGGGRAAAVAAAGHHHIAELFVVV